MSCPPTPSSSSSYYYYYSPDSINGAIMTSLKIHESKQFESHPNTIGKLHLTEVSRRTK